MPVSRVAIEHALDTIASDEGGMRFQGLAVVLAKLRWPELIACERKWDLGLDAHAPAILSPLHVGMGLCSSITPELEKIQADAKRAKPHFSDLQILVFVTSGTRAHPIAPPLPGSSRFRIQPLTRQERGDYVRTRLGDGAQPLIEQLRANRVLDDLTRTPMILAEVISLFQAGKKIPTSRLGVLDAVTQMMENSETHQTALENAPLSGLGRAFLERLGSSLVTRGGVQLPEATARQEISACLRVLQDAGQLGALPDPGNVLTALCSHHVLERSTYPDISYTFFHQQFQESFAAFHLKRELADIVTTGTGRDGFAARYVNEPAWTQPVEMLAEFIGRHSEDQPLPNAVAMGQTLVEMALPLDAVFAAKLARLCGPEVWRVTREALGARLRQLWQSSFSQHKDIAVDHRSKQGNGAVMSWTGWYVQAMIHLAADAARNLLIRLLTAPDYEHDAAWGLFQLARSERPSPLFRARAWPMRSKDFSLIWKARASEGESIFREPQRTELAAVLRQHIETLVAERAAEPQPAALNGRLKHLAIVLAELDGQASAELVLEILSYPQIEPSRPRTHRASTHPVYLYDAWPRIHGLEALLMQGLVLPNEKTWEIVEPIIEHVRAHRWNSQESSLISHVVGIVLFTDDPSASIQRVQQLIEEKLLSMEGARELTKALGHSRCPDAVALLRELASDTVRVQYLGNDWVDAVAQFDSEEARNLLLSFIDPALPTSSNELTRHNDGRLVRRLTELAQRDVAVRQRMFDLAQDKIPAVNALVLGKVLANLGTTDALLTSLLLLRDDSAGGASYQLHKNIEQAFVEHRPYPGSSNAVTMVPRSSNAIRSRLMEMVQNDPLRRRSAFALLNEIEKWRMWHGRPDGEPRSPKIETGFLWPPELEGSE